MPKIISLPIRIKNLDMLLRCMESLAEQIRQGKKPGLRQQHLYVFETAVGDYETVKGRHWLREKHANKPNTSLQIIQDYAQSNS